MKSFDFTLKTYEILLQKILEKKYKLPTFENYLLNKEQFEKIIIIRKDVDSRPQNSLKFAELENKLGISTSYYFRIVKKANNPSIIKKIVSLGHEIGYHYEDLSSTHGNYEEAIEIFKQNLNYFSQFYPVKTICMHGSPMSKWDNRDIWKRYNYRDYNIIGEPFFDLDFNEFYYLTETGRRWNGYEVSVRDKVKQNWNIRLKSTWDIIKALEEEILPIKIMMTIHPQRWDDKLIFWTKELFLQNAKNIIKRILLVNNENNR